MRRALAVLVLAAAALTPARATSTPTSTSTTTEAATPADGGEPRPRPIQDNSFLLEEAYNQEPGVIQHIGTFHRVRGGDYAASFTEEWPALGQAHQVSATFEYLREDGSRGPADLALHWRWQAVGSGEAPIAVAPRASLLVPTGTATRGRGEGGWGVELALPASVELSRRLVLHANLGAAVVPEARTPDGRGTAWRAHLGQGLVFLAHPRVNLLVETLYELGELSLSRGGTVTEESLLVSPGVRAAIDVGDLQIVPGVAAPLGVGPSSGERGVFLYLSLEHPAF